MRMAELEEGDDHYSIYSYSGSLAARDYVK
jgi:hypothetical protein